MAVGKVWFIGAGPGDPELITVKGRRLIAEADVVLYAGSLVPAELVAAASGNVVDSAPLTLEETHALMARAALAGGLVARVHTGDPSLYGAVAEQARLLDADGIPWEVVPGVTAALAAAAAAGVSFTVPEGTQSLTITRLSGRTPVPEPEAVENFAHIGGAMAIYLSTHMADTLRDRLLAGGYAPETRAVIGHRVGWPDQRIVRTTVERLATDAAGMGRQAVFLVLPGQGAETRSRLYAPSFGHGWRDGQD